MASVMVFRIDPINCNLVFSLLSRMFVISVRNWCRLCSAAGTLKVKISSSYLVSLQDLRFTCICSPSHLEFVDWFVYSCHCFSLRKNSSLYHVQEGPNGFFRHCYTIVGRLFVSLLYENLHISVCKGLCNDNSGFAGSHSCFETIVMLCWPIFKDFVRL